MSRYFWIRNFFFAHSKISTSTRIRGQIEFAHLHVSDTHPTRIRSSTQDSFGNIDYWACVVKRTKFASCSASFSSPEPLGLICDVTKKRFRIHNVFKNLHSGDLLLKIADSFAGFTEYVWTETVSGKKKLRIQNWTRPYSQEKITDSHFWIF